MGREFGRGVIIGIALLTAMIVGIAVTSYLNTLHLREYTDRDARSRELLDAINIIRTETRRLQAHQRGYLLSGIEDWLQLYHDAARDLREGLDRLEILTDADTEHSPRVRAAGREVEGGLVSLNEVIELRRARGVHAVSELAQARGPRSFVDPLLEILADMDRIERNRLGVRVQETNDAFSRAILYGFAAAVLSLFALGMFTWLLLRNIRGRARYAARLAEQRELLDATLTSIGDGVIATDGLGKVTFLNGVAEKLTGWTKEEARGAPLDQVFHIENEDAATPIENPALRALRLGIIVSLANHAVLIAKDGSRRSIDDSAAPIRDYSGQVSGAVLVFRDISSRRKSEAALRASEERSEFVRQSSGVGFWYCDLPFDILNWDERVKEHFHLARDAVVTMDMFYERLHPDDRERTRAAIERAVEQHADYDVVYRTIDPHTGAMKWVRAIGRTFFSPDGRAEQFDGVTLDITKQRTVEEQISQKEDRLKLLVDRSRDYAVVISDRDGKIVEWTGGAESITGYAPAEVLNGPSDVLYTDEDRAAGVPDQEMETAAREGRAEDKRWHIRKDGGRFFADGVLVPLRSDDGQLRGFGKVFRDISDRKRAEEALREENRVVETLNALGARMAAELDLNRLLQMVTDEATALTTASFGAFFYNATDERGDAYSLYTLAGAPREAFAQFPHPRATALFEPTFKGTANVRLADVTLDQRFGKNEPYFGLPHGHLPVRSYLAVPVRSRSGEVLGGLFLGNVEVGVFTERHERLAAGIAAQAAVAIDNARLYEHLREQDRRKDEFLATLAHELRNPLAPVCNGVQFMRTVTSEPAVGFNRTLDMMQRQLDHLVHMVDDLLDVSRVSSGKIVLRKELVNLKSVVESAIETSRNVIEKARNELRVHLPVESIWFMADPTRLVQVIANLLNNAAKYTPHGGAIELTATREGAEGVIRVTDTGVGIPPEMLRQIFEMFAQVGTSLERSQGGLGIGLTLVKRLIEMHGGTIEATSAGPGKGSTFAVRLPLADVPATEPTNAESSTETRSEKKKRQVLVVDDNRDSADSLTLLLRMMGHEIMTAYDGAGALQILEGYHPGIIFLDLGMPGMNGFEVAQRIRQKPELSNTLLVALTGWGQEEDRRRTQQTGFNFHLVKPADPAMLQQLLSSGS
jgi:PAS domain S-box-containing protein